jgi:hypothetical protein
MWSSQGRDAEFGIAEFRQLFLGLVLGAFIFCFTNLYVPLEKLHERNEGTLERIQCGPQVCDISAIANDWEFAASEKASWKMDVPASSRVIDANLKEQLAKNLRSSPKTSVFGQRKPQCSDHAVSTVCRRKRRRVFGQRKGR